jgi:electron transport complex protein RnfB
MSDNNQPTRRQFFGIVGRGAGLIAVGGLGLHLVLGRDSEKVWQLDPTVCDGCSQLNLDSNGVLTHKGSSICSTNCVLKLSAVKAVNDFTNCGYCNSCPAYFDADSPNGPDGLPTGRVCPYDAIIRRAVGYVDPKNPALNCYEYTIDETKCTGCGKCVIRCKPPKGRASLRLEVRHNLCVGCNQCSIAQACPAKKTDPKYYGAFYRDGATNKWPAKAPKPLTPEQASIQASRGPR